MRLPEPYYDAGDVAIYHADARTAHEWLPERSAHAIVTSPPYWGLRDYGEHDQLGLEESPQDYIDGLADLLTGYGERVLREDGSLWLNLGDTYAANRSKCLLMIPERVALALIERGWILRNKVVWAKPNGMPTSVQDRLATKWEYLFHFVRAQRYYYDLDAIRVAHAPGSLEVYKRGLKPQAHPSADNNGGGGTQVGIPAGHVPTRGVNPGDVWTVPTQPYPGAHFAVYPPELIRRPILATVPEQACRECGTGRERIMERTSSKDVRERYSHRGETAWEKAGRNDGDWKGSGQEWNRWKADNPDKHVGWSDCGCDAGWTAGTVLDPFFGSGTTGVMARRLGRKTVGVELSEDYCRLAAQRFREQVLDFGGAA